MIVDAVGENEDIIKVDDYKLSTFIKHSAKYPLKVCWQVRKPEWGTIELIFRRSPGEGCLFSIRISDRELSIS
jgi:hypothetical protein